jgi:5-methylcytosine-specific restriction endonuclease McrA
VKALLSAKFPKGMPLEQLLDAVLDEFIEKHDPTCRESRRLKRKEKNSGVVRTKCKSKLAVSAEKTTPLNRHIPAAIRDRVYARDNGRCSYVSPAGIKCNSKWNLEIDHIVPFARGGDHSVDNLRLLCARHNRLAAENVYGREYIKNKMPGTTRPHRE